jgi:cytochrome c oxidase subunit II
MNRDPFARLSPSWNDLSAAGQAAFLSPVVAVLANGGPENLNMFDPVSPPAFAIRDLFYLVLGITGAIFVLVEGMLVYCIFRFRQKNNTTMEPPQIYGSKPIEVAWTVAPLLIVFVLFLVTVRCVNEVRVNAADIPKNALKVTVVGHQWWWEYQYTDLKNDAGQPLIIANELHVPAGRPIFLELKSVDVIHSFWVPRLLGKTDVVPGHTNTTWFQVDQVDQKSGEKRTGLYLGQCAEYCSGQHGNMMLRVYVDTPEDFEIWLSNQKKRAEDDSRVRAERDYFLSQACVNCHVVRGTMARGTFGPDLTHLMSRETLATGMVPNDPKNLRDWVADPQTIKPRCLMPDMHLTGPEVDRMVAYLLTLK